MTTLCPGARIMEESILTGDDWEIGRGVAGSFVFVLCIGEMRSGH